MIVLAGRTTFTKSATPGINGPGMNCPGMHCQLTLVCSSSSAANCPSQRRCGLRLAVEFRRIVGKIDER
eukprot:6203345-Pleurochrysis_carterae.AAC.1